jgi:dipeptidyl aminopeptidase/acylaminoacyl peptidase
VVFDTSAPQEDLFVVAAAGGEVRPLTNDLAKDRSPSWSPDGSRILFYSNRSGKFEVWAIRPDGRGLEQLTDSRGGHVFNPLWSPDGSKIACFLGDSGEAVIDLSRPLAARVPEALPPFDFSATSWSSQGRLAGQGGNELVLYSFARRAYERLGVSGQDASWLRDGRRLLFLQQGRVVELDSGTREIREIAAPAPNSSYAHLSVSRDGHGLFLVRAVEEGDVWLLTVSSTSANF